METFLKEFLWIVLALCFLPLPSSPLYFQGQEVNRTCTKVISWLQWIYCCCCFFLNVQGLRCEAWNEKALNLTNEWSYWDNAAEDIFFVLKIFYKCYDSRLRFQNMKMRMLLVHYTDKLVYTTKCEEFFDIE